MPIHPTAVIDGDAEVDGTVIVGPYVVIAGRVRIGPGTVLGPHVVILGEVDIGCRNRVHAGAVIGDEPQDLAYRGEATRVEIGDDNVLREHVQIHRGTQAGSVTRIGNGNFLMTNVHVAHNCSIGSRVILASGVLLGGHVRVDDGAFVSGNCVVHQHVRVGRFALLRGLSRTSRDVPPFCIMDGTHTVRAINRIGLRRAGFPPERIAALQRAFGFLFRRPGQLGQRLTALEARAETDEVRELIAFIRGSTRGVCVGPRQSVRPAEAD